MGPKSKLRIAGVIIIIVSFVVSIYTAPYFIELAIRKFSRIWYIDDYAVTNGILGMYIFFLVFSVLSFYWNVRTLKAVGKLTIGQLSLHCIIDLAAIPISILIMILLNNRRLGSAGLTSVLNPLSLAFVLLCKQGIMLMTSARFAFGKRK